MKNVREMIQIKCSNATGNIYDIYYALYMDFLSESQLDNPASILQELLEEVSRYKFEDDKNYKYIAETDIEETQNHYFSLLSAYIHSLTLDNLNEQDFYSKIYNVVFKSDIFPQDIKSQSILLYFLAEKIPEIPYFQATNLLKMPAEEYKATIQRLNPQIEKIINILNRRFATRTEEASQIYEIISSIEDKKDKIVLLAVYTNIIQRNINNRQ
ncbi:hypothetical protein HFM85_07170 [Blautia schinkii]|uniref:hypothetical protein n=1 Tax=Blautia schinkii TaxID=180164 RepID=UPI0015710456|nr:hypothetical protein [Blautia schinkii]NSG82168.1 hypothetical protein [Blautia schinkii]NSK22771.1 hypothetical protein [Blautia schinkii]NSK25811.1 hypothetical protein [Blautia schinkii]NSK31781.1 hypothetical protein [Blautia schinkii]NSK49241.1 hypothetical protein [Blautia schinkii]